MVSNLPGGRSQKRLSTAHHHKTAHPASSKTGSAVPLPEASVRPPEHQDPCGSVPVQAFVPVSDQTLSGSSEDLSLPPQPPAPPLPPPPPPPPPPPLPPALSSFQGTTHQNLGLRTLATEDRPLPLACDPSAGRPCDYQGPGNPLQFCSLWVLKLLKKSLSFNLESSEFLSLRVCHHLLSC
jgi:hypothetical protein